MARLIIGWQGGETACRLSSVFSKLPTGTDVNTSFYPLQSLRPAGFVVFGILLALTLSERKTGKH
ncbi:hypothetical protein [Marinobacter sp.]|uniref:hypothetical protein n=1 Tax=Marinobacter sp. TaxID=50741 RepID=UPI002B270972|nr:hypothetical protein [Marinobacter sp.]